MTYSRRTSVKKWTCLLWMKQPSGRQRHHKHLVKLRLGSLGQERHQRQGLRVRHQRRHNSPPAMLEPTVPAQSNQVNGERTPMAVNPQRRRPVPPRNLRNPVPASDGGSERTTTRRVHVGTGHSSGDKHFLATETGWRIASTIFSLGAVAGASYAVLWYTVIHR